MAWIEALRRQARIWRKALDLARALDGVRDRGQRLERRLEARGVTPAEKQALFTKEVDHGD